MSVVRWQPCLEGSVTSPFSLMTGFSDCSVVLCMGWCETAFLPRPVWPPEIHQTLINRKKSSEDVPHHWPPFCMHKMSAWGFGLGAAGGEWSREGAWAFIREGGKMRGAMGEGTVQGSSCHIVCGGWLPRDHWAWEMQEGLCWAEFDFPHTVCFSFNCPFHLFSYEIFLVTDLSEGVLPQHFYLLKLQTKLTHRGIYIRSEREGFPSPSKAVIGFAEDHRWLLTCLIVSGNHWLLSGKTPPWALPAAEPIPCCTQPPQAQANVHSHL